MKIEKLNFSVRTYNILKRANINDVEQLKQLSNDELLQIRNLGRHSFEEIKEKLECYTMTNADHIRSMTDEELADLLYNFGMSNIAERGKTEIAMRADKYHIELWLRTPYKENTDD